MLAKDSLDNKRNEVTLTLMMITMMMTMIKISTQMESITLTKIVNKKLNLEFIFKT